MTRIFLDPGTHEYKFFVDGAWHLDANNPERSPAGNSVVRVGDAGQVLPANTPSSDPDRPATNAATPVSWSMRYLGFATARRAKDAPRYDLDRPIHDVDLRLDAAIAPEVEAWLLANVTSHDADGDVDLRYDRGLLSWTSASMSARLFDHVRIGNFDDPAALVGRVGIYGDPFGYGRRGVALDRRLLGAPLQFLLADDEEPLPNRPPPLVGFGLATVARPEHYLSSDSERDADVWAFRARGGTDALGIGASFRWDRGAHAGLVTRSNTTIAGDTLHATGRRFETREDSYAWGLDARGTWRELLMAAEHVRGQNRAVAQSAVDFALDATPGDTLLAEGTAVSDRTRFDLDQAHRTVLRFRRDENPAAATTFDPWWKLRPNAEDRLTPELRFEFESHGFEPLVTGTGFRMRRFEIGVALDTRRWDTQFELDVEHHSFDMPQGATWETQFWLRRHVFWLDEDLAGVARMPLLGTDRAGMARLRAAREFGHGVRAEFTGLVASPGFDRTPRFFENVLRLTVPLARRLVLQTHSRLATYRTFTASDSTTIATLGSAGPHFEMGAVPVPAGASHGFESFSAHFIELVLQLSPHADLGLGFGLDPIAVYEVSNQFADVGWDQFLFENGVAPEAVVQHPTDLGRRVQAAEAALEGERRIVIEARVRF